MGGTRRVNSAVSQGSTSIVQYNYLDFLVTLVLLRPGNIYKQTVKVSHSGIMFVLGIPEK